MKAKELAKLLMVNPVMDVVVDCYVGGSTYDNPYPKHESYDVDDVHVLCNGCRNILIIVCS